MVDPVLSRATQQIAEQSVQQGASQGAGQVRTQHDMRMENIQEKLVSPDGGELTVQDAMSLQFEVMQMGIEHELTTKVADKTSEGVQTLFKQQ